jgi:hypothetical protein
VYNGGLWDIVANSGDVIDSSKYSVSKNPLTGLYYRLHIETFKPGQEIQLQKEF